MEVLRRSIHSFFKINIQLIALVSCMGLSSCGSTQTYEQESALKSMEQAALRHPAALDMDKTGCFSGLIPILREGAIYSDENISAIGLGQRGLLDLNDYDELRSQAYWQEVVAREGMSERDEELGYIALSMIKKKYPRISDEGLKDRYDVLKAFCGN